MTVIIDYDAGNLRSVQRACAEVGLAARITNDAREVAHADRVIFPGVGAAHSAMKSIKASGLDVALRHALDAGTPVFGICLGLQISLDHSEEGDTPTLGLIEGRVVKFRLDDPTLKIPHMGWNEVKVVKPHPLLRKVPAGASFYFVHSYYPQPTRPQDVYAQTEYERPFACALGRGNYFATQFHP
ncbi:MAG TPA: imidazole glycerol phosphate synthase subunit HisH, partial [Pseudomonadales bacterium]|nr:imidazole glycerol phosphate synthase subunit HisH [Pseudomonadales bacterium]